MRANRIHKEVQRRVSRRALGLNPYAARMNQSQLRSATLDGELLALPEETEGRGEIQNADGSFKFMVGFSRVGGPDLVG